MKMDMLKKTRILLIIVTLAFLGLLVNFLNQKTELDKVKDELMGYEIRSNHIPGGDITSASLMELSDSLRNEVFIREVQLGKYEIAIELLKEKNKKAAEEFELILTTQTE